MTVRELTFAERPLYAEQMRASYRSEKRVAADVFLGSPFVPLLLRKLIALPGDAGRAGRPHGIGLGARLRARA